MRLTYYYEIWIAKPVRRGEFSGKIDTPAARTVETPGERNPTPTEEVPVLPTFLFNKLRTSSYSPLTKESENNKILLKNH